MRVWIENPFDNLPLEGFRPQRFWLMAEAFAAAGCDVTLWTSDFNHTTKKKRVLDGANAPCAFRGFRCILVPSIPYSGNVSVRRMFSHWRYAATWEKMARRDAAANGRPDVAIVSTPPLCTGAAARRMARDFKARLVFDVMDAWPETFERVAPRWMLAPLRRLARANYLAADLVTTVADNYVALVRSYGYAGPVRRFYHGIAGCGAALPPRDSGALRLVYIGNLGRTYDLATPMRALAALPGATLDIAGKGEQEPALRQLAAELGAPVAFHGYLGEDALNELLAASGIGIVPMAPESCVGVPYKFADYSRMGLGIVSSLGGESGRLLAKYGAGESYAPGDADAFAAAVRKISASPAAYRSASFALAKTEFSAESIYRAYASLVLS